MKYRPLPFITTLENLAENDQPASVKLRSQAMSEFARSNGAQLLTHILREIEARAFAAIRTGISNDRTGKALGRIEAIEEIRQSLTLLLLESEREAVDWFDDQEEEFIDKGSVSPSKE